MAIYSPNLALNYNGSLIFEWEKFGWIAGTYKSNYAVGLNVGVNLFENLKIGLAYDFQMNDVAVHNEAPNFEIILHYKIPHFSKKDTLFIRDTIVKLKPQIKLQEVINMDSINVLNLKIKALQDSLNNIPPSKNKSKNSSTSTIIKDGVNIKKNADDHFLEIFDHSDSPNGLYVIVESFSEKNRAQKLLKTSKTEYPDAKLIYNERNDLHYVILYYSKSFDNVKAAYLRSRSLKGGRFYKAWILDYQR